MKSQLAHSQDTKPWQQPKPLTMRPAGPGFPVHVLPKMVKDAVIEVQKNVKAPAALVAGSALSAMSLAAQAHFDVRRAPRLSGPIGLFILQIADSGERKTSCDDYFITPIDEWQAQELAQTAAQQQAFDAKEAAQRARRDGLLAAMTRLTEEGEDCGDLERQLQELETNPAEKPKSPEILLVDETPESLAARLYDWPSVGVISSEAGLVFGSHAMNPDAVTRNLSQLNALWDGQTLSIGRKTSQNIKVRNARLTIGLQVQPMLFREFIRRAGLIARGSGFFSRFLISEPESTQGSRFFEDPTEHIPTLDEMHARIFQLLSEEPALHPNGGLSPKVLDLSPDAKAYWVAYHDKIEHRLGPGGPFFEIRDLASKSAENAARLAAVLHAFTPQPGDHIELGTMESACEISHWYLEEAKRVLATYQPSPDLLDAMELETWILERSTQGIVPVTKVQQCITPTRLRSKARLERPLALLEQLHRVRRRKIGNKTHVEVNPHLLS